MIEPTVGRKLWYRPKLCFSAFPPKVIEGNYPVMAHDQPFDATVLHVNDDGTINVLVCNEIGAQMGLTDIVLAQDRTAQPGECEWMPYQVKMADASKAAIQEAWEAEKELDKARITEAMLRPLVKIDGEYTESDLAAFKKHWMTTIIPDLGKPAIEREDRSSWTTREWVSHSGGELKSDGSVVFGSRYSVTAMLFEYHAEGLRKLMLMPASEREAAFGGETSQRSGGCAGHCHAGPGSTHDSNTLD